jgi:hemerythrin
MPIDDAMNSFQTQNDVKLEILRHINISILRTFKEHFSEEESMRAYVN